MRLNIRWQFALQAMLLALLAAASRYHLPDFADSDWSTVLFLTPYGIAKNILVPSAITTFYGEPSPGNSLLDAPHLAFLGILYLAGSVNALLLLLRLRKKT